MKIEDIRLGMPMVSASGIPGTVVAISKEGGLWLETADRTRFPVHVECAGPMSNPCNECEMAATIVKQCKQIAELQKSLDKMTCKSNAAHRSARYWRDELDGLQKRVLAESAKESSEAWRCTGGYVYEGDRQMAAVAKCYKQVEPEQLLLSAEARRVVEYLKARDCPLPINYMLESMSGIMSGAAILDGLIEAREAGIVRLDDGKYSIVRD